jgi:hypothetical protein
VTGIEVSDLSKKRPAQNTAFAKGPADHGDKADKMRHGEHSWVHSVTVIDEMKIDLKDCILTTAESNAARVGAVDADGLACDAAGFVRVEAAYQFNCRHRWSIAFLSDASQKGLQMPAC